jgi:hypothetical protein
MLRPKGFDTGNDEAHAGSHGLAEIEPEKIQHVLDNLANTTKMFHRTVSHLVDYASHAVQAENKVHYTPSHALYALSIMPARKLMSFYTRKQRPT